MDVYISYKILTKLTNMPIVYACMHSLLNFETRVVLSLIKYKELRFVLLKILFVCVYVYIHTCGGQKRVADSWN